MTNEAITKTLIIQSRGRKYFTCKTGGFEAQLVIDDVTRDLEVDRIVTIVAIDQSIRSGYGTQLRFQALEILGDRSAEEARVAAAARKAAERWLGYAEGDTSRGLWRTNAIGEASRLVPAHPDLGERLAAMLERVAANRAAEPQREAERWLGYAESDAAEGLARTKAITTALQLAPAFDHLGPC